MSSYYDQAIQTIQENNASLTPEAVEAAGNAVLFTDSDWAIARKNIRTSVGQGTYEDSIARRYRNVSPIPGNSPIPINRDHAGITFFTRPNLHLTDANLKRDRRLWSLRTDNPNSIQAVVRDYLDPVGARKRNHRGRAIVDERNPFISILTDNLTDISGFNDMEMQVYQGKPGLRQETVVMADGSVDMFQPYNLNATFKNIMGNPIMFLHYIWLIYIAGVHNGELTPSPQAIIDNEMDYWTRCYRIILDPTGMYVRYIFAPTAMFPVGLPIGNMANYSIDKPFTQDNERITIPYQAVGNNAFDEILKDEFNRLVLMFYYGENDTRTFLEDEELVPISPYERRIMSYRVDMYPFIHPLTSELLWFVPADDYNEFYLDLEPSALPPDTFSRDLVRTTIPQNYEG